MKLAIAASHEQQMSYLLFAWFFLFLGLDFFDFLPRGLGDLALIFWFTWLWPSGWVGFLDDDWLHLQRGIIQVDVAPVWKMVVGKKLYSEKIFISCMLSLEFSDKILLYMLQCLLLLWLPRLCSHARLQSVGLLLQLHIFGQLQCVSDRPYFNLLCLWICRLWHFNWSGLLGLLWLALLLHTIIVGWLNIAETVGGHIEELLHVRHR